MESFTGRPIRGQIAYGRLHFFSRVSQELPHISQLTCEEEQQRFDLAKARTAAALTAYYDRTCRELGEEYAGIFSMHALILDDEGFKESISAQLQLGVTAEYAVRTAGHDLVSYFRSMEDPYMQARAADLRDICRQLLTYLLQTPPADPFHGEPVILVADEILPSEVIRFKRHNLLGFISRTGSVNSHSAMLLDAYHIPALTSVDLSPAWDGHLALMDGFDGRLYLDPSSSLAETLRLRYECGGSPSARLQPAAARA